MSLIPDEELPVTEDDFARMLEADAKAELPGTDTPVDETLPQLEETPAPEVVPEVPEVDTPEAPEALPETPEPVPGTGEEEEVVVASTPAEVLDWAQRVGVTNFEEAAKKAYEQEKFIGQRTTELAAMRDLATQWEDYATQLEARVNSSGGPSDEWVEQALASPDPAHFAMELYVAGDQAGYSKLMSTWEQYDPETPGRLHAYLEQNARPVGPPVPQAQGSHLPPSVQPPAPDAAIVRNAFVAAGVLDMDNDPIMPEVYKLLAGSPEYQAAMRSNDLAYASLAAKGLVDTARSQRLKVSEVRMTAQQEQQAASDEARRAAALSGNGSSPTRTAPVKSATDAAMEDEWRRMGVLPVDSA